MTPVPVLLYHSVDPEPAVEFGPWAITPETLSAHLSALRQAGYTPVPVRSLLAARERGEDLPGRPCVVTFDDGFRDFADHALPVLRAADVPSTLFVTSGWLGGTAVWLAPLGQGGRPMLTADEVARIAAAGDVTIGGHGHSHAMLDLLSPAAQEKELDTSRRALIPLVGQDVDLVAYPHGYADRSVQRAAAAAGFRVGFGVHDRLADPQGSPWSLARLVIAGDTSADALLQRLASASGREPRWRPVARVCWRGVRRVTMGSTQRLLGLPA